MKKRTKKAFSLAELLIALGIISVISTMGITIGKKGVERAFNQYYFTAYNGLYSIIFDAVENNIPIYNSETTGLCPTTDFADNLKRYKITVGKNEVDNPLAYTACDQSFKAPNSVAVTIGPTQAEGTTGEIYAPMTLSFPAPNGKRAHYEVYYFPTYMNGILMPSLTTNSAQNVISVQNRPDLLPFYIDDGESGRLVSIYDDTSQSYTVMVYDKANDTYKALSESNAYTPFKYQSFSNAYCDAGYSPLTNIITCTGTTTNTTSSNKLVIRPANPRKVF